MASLSRYVSVTNNLLRQRLPQIAACQYSSVKKSEDFSLDKIDPGKIAHEDPHFGKVFSKDYKMPDSLGESVGSARFELLSKLLGDDDPFEMKPVKLRESSREKPHLIPTTSYARMMGCICNSEINYVHWMRLQKGVTTRCKCGHFFKVVDYDTYHKHENEHLKNRFEKVKDLPDMQAFLQEVEKRKEVMDELYTKFEALDEKSDEAQRILDQMHEVDARVKKLEKEMVSKYFG